VVPGVEYPFSRPHAFRNSVAETDRPF
jgi:hypothetical protein